jgi:hypothetical protein
MCADSELALYWSRGTREHVDLTLVLLADVRLTARLRHVQRPTLRIN